MLPKVSFITDNAFIKFKKMLLSLPVVIVTVPAGAYFGGYFNTCIKLVC